VEGGVEVSEGNDVGMNGAVEIIKGIAIWIDFQMRGIISGMGKFNSLDGLPVTFKLP